MNRFKVKKYLDLGGYPKGGCF